MPGVLRIPEQLFGREESVQALFTAYERVATGGHTELMLVSGYSGVGKSSVVNELQALVSMILRSSEAELGRWRDDIRMAVAPNGQLLTALLPELELVIGPQPAVPDLPPQDARNRIQMVFRAFLRVFAQVKHPLVLFLDDLQWVDSATLVSRSRQS